MTTNPVMSITDEQIAEIEALAKEALPGGWHVENGMGMVYDSQMDFVCDTSEDEPCRSAHIAAANPDSVLALISRLRAAERDAARYRWLRDGCDEKYSPATHIAVNCYGMDWDAAIDTAMKGDQQ